MIEHRDSSGRVRRYSDGSARLSFHSDLKPQPTDAERISVVAADKEVMALQILAQHLDISDAGLSRILRSLRIIQRALDIKRLRLGMAMKI